MEWEKFGCEEAGKEKIEVEAGPGTRSTNGNSEIPPSTLVYLSYGKHFKFKQNYYA